MFRRNSDEFRNFLVLISHYKVSMAAQVTMHKLEQDALRSWQHAQGDAKRKETAIVGAVGATNGTQKVVESTPRLTRPWTRPTLLLITGLDTLYNLGQADTLDNKQYYTTCLLLVIYHMWLSLYSTLALTPLHLSLDSCLLQLLASSCVDWVAAGRVNAWQA
jgi:hypothetical protein